MSDAASDGLSALAVAVATADPLRRILPRPHLLDPAVHTAATLPSADPSSRKRLQRPKPGGSGGGNDLGIQENRLLREDVPQVSKLDCLLSLFVLGSKGVSSSSRLPGT